MRAPLAIVALLVAGSLGAGCRSRCCPRSEAVLPCPTVVEVGAASEAQVLVEIEVFEIPEARLATLLAEPAPAPGKALVLVPGQRAALDARLAADASVRVLNAPSLVTAVGDEGSLFVGENDGKPDWSGLAARFSPRLAGAPNTVELDLDVTQRTGDASTEQHVQLRGQRVESQLSLVLLGAARPDGSPRFVVRVRPTLLLPPTQ